VPAFAAAVVELGNEVPWELMLHSGKPVVVRRADDRRIDHTQRDARTLDAAVGVEAAAERRIRRIVRPERVENRHGSRPAPSSPPARTAAD
jgi:hypothetical protein